MATPRFLPSMVILHIWMRPQILIRFQFYAITIATAIYFLFVYKSSNQFTQASKEMI